MEKPRPRSAATSWIRNPSDRVAIRAGYYFDEAAADHVCEFFARFLRHSSGRWAGRAFELEPWQRDYLSRLFGWKRPDGRRRFGESYLEVPKKNGKSAMIAGIALYMLFAEPAAEVYLGAVNRSQARIVFTECARMVAKSPPLKRHLRVIENTATIRFAAANAKIEAMSSDAEAKDGRSATCTVFDEVHRYKNRRSYDVMKYAGAAREEPLIVSITTAGTDRHSLCYELHQRGRSVLDGTTADLEFLPVIYAADEGDDLDDPAVWKKANPSLGVILSIEDFRAEYEQAKRIPSQLNNFKRLRFNLWVESASRWLPLPLWDAGLEPIDPAELAGLSCYAALDLSSVKDLTSLSLVFVIGQTVRVIPFIWLPEETATERAEADGVPYPEWIEAGHIIATPGNATDFDAIRAKLKELRKTFDIVKVGIDPWNAQSLTNDLIEDDFDVVEVRQGYATLSGPSKELERLLLAGRLRHDGNPVLRWAIGNAATETDPAGNIKPSKRRSTERIDPVVSTVMALGLAHSEIPQAVPSFTPLP